MDSKVIIVAGMHRSGTSLTTDLLRNMGVNMGDKLLGADPANQFGFWEDMDFLSFHENLFEKRGRDYLVASPEIFTPDEEETAHAKELIQKKYSQPIWGWKDPRTSLFLDFWRKLIPTAKFILVYRYPAESVLSLMKAAHNPIVLNPEGGLMAWKIYNESILRFYERYPEQSILCNIHSIVQNYDAFLNLVSSRFGLVRTAVLEKVYHPGALNLLPVPEWFNIYMERKCPGVLDLYNTLQEKSDLPFHDTAESKLSDEQTMIFMDYAVKSFSGIYNRLWEWHGNLQREREQLINEREQLINERQQLREDLYRMEHTRARLIVKKLEGYPRLINIMTRLFDVLMKPYYFFRKSDKI
jgi:O-antigen biosynthesis protein